MADRCPCGCGTRVGLLKKGAAKATQTMDEALAALHEVIRDLDTDPELRAEFEDSEALRSFEQGGKQIRSWLLDHLHGTARPGQTPDLLAIKRAMDNWLATGNAFFAALTR